MSKKIYLEVSEIDYSDAKEMDFYILVEEYLKPALKQALNNYRATRSNNNGRNKK